MSPRGHSRQRQESAGPVEARNNHEKGSGTGAKGVWDHVEVRS